MNTAALKCKKLAIKDPTAATIEYVCDSCYDNLGFILVNRYCVQCPAYCTKCSAKDTTS